MAALAAGRAGSEQTRMKETPIRIQAGSTEDRKWCARLMAASDPWITLGQDLAACRAKLKRPGAEVFVARPAGEKSPLGFILLLPYGFAGSPYINSIGVASEAHGRGIGAALLRFAERRFADRGWLFLLVSSFNLRAQAFYRREGYEFVGELKDYILAGHSELIFFKKLS
jgi:[ribosomal protein S18]-alanine N-acetyltransferase